MCHKESAYGTVRFLQQELAGQQFQLATRPELPGFEAPEPALPLLAATIEIRDARRLLIVGDELGALTAAMAVAGGEIHARAATFVGKELTRRTIQINGLHCNQIEDGAGLPADAIASYDLVAMLAPPQRDLARRWLCEAHAALRPGGRLYLAGANQAGIQPIIGDAAALFGTAGQIANRARQRVAVARRSPAPPPAPAWARAAGIAPASWYEFSVTVRGRQLQLASRPGIFAYDRLDRGTAMLLETMQLPVGAQVLDVGCGYGIIGLLAAHLGAAHVDLSDNSFAAVAASTRNLASNGIANARVLAGDVLGAVAGERYDMILSNPPFHSGKRTSYAVTRALIGQARAALKPGGRLLLVANRFLPYEQELRAHFSQVARRAGNEQYIVWEAISRG